MVSGSRTIGFTFTLSERVPGAHHITFFRKCDETRLIVVSCVVCLAVGSMANGRQNSWKRAVLSIWYIQVDWYIEPGLTLKQDFFNPIPFTFQLAHLDRCKGCLFGPWPQDLKPVGPDLLLVCLECLNGINFLAHLLILFQLAKLVFHE